MNHNGLLSPIRLRPAERPPALAASPLTDESLVLATPSASSTEVSAELAQATSVDMQAPAPNGARPGSPLELQPPEAAVGVGFWASGRQPGRPWTERSGFGPHQRLTLRMAGFGDGQIMLMNRTVLLERRPDRAPWLLAHHEGLLQQGFNTEQLVTIVRLASRQARDALLATSAGLLAQGFSRRQLVTMTITPGAAAFLEAMLRHGEVLSRRGYSHGELMVFANANQAARRLAAFASMYWPDGRVPYPSRLRIRDTFLAEGCGLDGLF